MIRDLSPEGADASDTADSAGAVVADPTAVPIRTAVSVLMVRDSAEGALEVFVQHRVSTMDFAAGVVVFPGGRVDPIDEEHARTLHIDDDLSHTSAWERSSIAEADDGWRVLLAAAVREVEEETGTVLDPEDLKPWANWVTPLGLPKRFDTYFFVAHAEALTSPRHTTTEAHSSEWMPVAEILEAEAAGRLKLMRPTLVLLGELADYDSAESVIASERAVIPVSPSFPRN